MAKYTPGPWHREGLTVLSKGWVSYPNKRIIASVRPYPRTREAILEGMDNARLMAAAPTMAEAIETILEYYLAVQLHRPLGAIEEANRRKLANALSDAWGKPWRE